MTYKTFQDGEVFSAADAQMLMDQSIISLPAKTALNLVPTPDPGQVVYLEDLDVYLRRVAGAWRCLTDFVIVANSVIRDQLPAPHVGLTVRSRDTGQEDRWDGAAWKPWATPWVALPLSNGWVSFGGAYAARYRLVGGFVSVEALVKSGTTASGTAVAQLPAGFRPGAQILFSTLSSTPANALAACYIDVTAGGAIVCGTNCQNGWLAIQLTFPTDQ